jgi:hypothetical protein
MNPLLLLVLATTTNPAPACVYNYIDDTLGYAAEPSITFEAAKLGWFFKGDLVRYRDGYYAKYGRPRQLAPFEIKPVGKKGNIPIFIDVDKDADAPETVYVMVKSADCSFQPYTQQHNPMPPD